MKRTHSLAAELHDLIDSTGELLESLKEEQGPAFDELRSRTKGRLKQARRALAEVEPSARKVAVDTLAGAASFIGRNPWRAVAIGAVLFAGLGMMRHLASSDS
ncbi:MAG: hypothetical protein WDO68_06785 [Gammaproteobacteria bacterium]